MYASATPLPCLYPNCVFPFRAIYSMTSHLSRYHPDNNQLPTLSTQEYLQCLNCGTLNCSVQALICHLRMHARRHETVVCPVIGCNFTSNILGTVACHFSRKHSSLSFSLIREEIKRKNSGDTELFATTDCNDTSDLCSSEHVISNAEGNDPESQVSESDLPTVSFDDIADEMMLFFLKLKTVHGTSKSAINDIINDVNRITEMSRGVISDSISTVLNRHNCSTEAVTEICDAVMNEIPLTRLTERGCLLSTEWRRECYARSHHTVIDPK
jgi:hypothetical protein